MDALGSAATMGAHIAGGVIGSVGAIENTVRGVNARHKAQHFHAAHELDTGDPYLEAAAQGQKLEAKCRAWRTGASVLGTAAGITAAATTAPIVGSAATAIGLAATMPKMWDSGRKLYRKYTSKGSLRRMAASILDTAIEADGEHHPHLELMRKLDITVPHSRNEIIPIRSPEYRHAVQKLTDIMPTRPSAEATAPRANLGEDFSNAPTRLMRARQYNYIGGAE
jgi:hypothetical protein